MKKIKETIKEYICEDPKEIYACLKNARFVGDLFKGEDDLPFPFTLRMLTLLNTVKGFDIAYKAEIDVFLEISCFFHDPADVGNLVSGSSAFSKASLNIWKFAVHVLLKPGLENFEHYFSRV